jgi:hypothetical protein
METKSNTVNTEKKIQVKFISNNREFFFMLPVLDENGKIVNHRNPDSNRELPEYKQYDFVKSPSKRSRDGMITTKDGVAMKVEPETFSCYFVVDQEKHGTDFQRIVDLLTSYCTNPVYKMYTEDEYFKQRNPEAYQATKEKEEMKSKLDSKDARIAELEERLGFRKK